jgi:glucuronoarabinoxylan endo-1,4-beta-xylanase
LNHRPHHSLRLQAINRYSVLKMVRLGKDMMMRTRLMQIICFILTLSFLVPDASTSAMDVVIDGAKQYQTIEGFGTCLIAWSGRFRELYRTEEFQKIYIEGVGCNMLRVNMWGPTFEKPTEDFSQIRCEDFDMEANGGRPQIFVDFGRGILKLNPDTKIIGSVWSPPSWMKMNESITDKKSGAIRAGDYREFSNRVDPKYFRHFCKWMVEYVKLHDKLGVPFYAVSPGNEVQFTQSFESCVWDGKDYASIIIMLREMLNAEGYSHVKTFGPETMTSHMYEGGTGSYVKAIKDNTRSLAALDVFATHGYEDGVKAEMSATSSRQFWDLIKDTGKPFWITEGGTGGHDWPQPIQKGIGNALHNALVAGNCSAFVPWQITESRKNTHCMMLMSEYTPKTYTAMHYSRFIKPGAVRIDAQPGFGDVQVGAFVHPKSRYLTIVAINPTEREQALNLAFKNLNVPVSLKVYRTSASENLKEAEEAPVNKNETAFKMMPLSIVTFSGKITQ